MRKSNPDFLEFHFSFKDLDEEIAPFFPEPLDYNLVVHSPDLFHGDHLLNLCTEDKEYRRRSIAELQRVLAPGGQFLFVTPVGRPRVCFNAHRVYSFEMVKKLFPGLELVQWALVRDDPSGGLVFNPDAEVINAQSYGCGCFRFSKPV
jgi:SAM-dependent methyltransferase